MREAWSINKHSVVWRVDRRTCSKYVELAGLKPAGSGAKGPLWDVREVAAALADAGFLGGDDPHRWREWGSDGGRESGGRELAERMADVLAKRLDRPTLRVVLETLAAELHSLIASIYAGAIDPAGGPALPWSELSDAELERALKALVSDGYLPSDDE